MLIYYYVRSVVKFIDKTVGERFLSCIFWKLGGTKYSTMDQVKFCGRHPLKNLKGYGLRKQTIPTQIF